jgi:transcriptional antiterminator NusG
MNEEQLPDEAPPEVPAESQESIAQAEPESAPAPAPASPTEPEGNPNFRWYVIKVASGREESIKDSIIRRVKIENLEPYVGQIVIPVERVTEIKKVRETRNGEKITKEKRVIKEKKKFPGYLMAQVEFTAEIQTLFRDTNGVGDFVGAKGPGKPPAPMSDRDVQSMLYGMLPAEQKGQVPKTPVKVKLDFEKGDKVRIRETSFAGMEGEVSMITEPKDQSETVKVQVVVQILGRTVTVDLDYWQVDKV